MIASVYSTLSGKLVGKHPELGVLVSEDGKVLCLNKGNKWGDPNAKCHWTAGNINLGGYRCVQFKKKKYSVHRLVAETFIPNPENRPTVDHYPDRSRDNNNVHNLRWADQKEQCRNTKSYDGAINLGVRKHDDPKEYARRNSRRLWNIKRQDPEYLKKHAEKARKYRAKKKAERSAQPSV